MAIKKFKARIKLKSGSQEIFIHADNHLKAKEMIEAQYGRGSIIVPPVETK